MTVRISFIRKLVIVLRVLMNNEAVNTVTSNRKKIFKKCYFDIYLIKIFKHRIHYSRYYLFEKVLIMKSKDYIGKIVEFRVVGSDGIVSTSSYIIKKVKNNQLFDKSGEVICNVEELDTSVEAKGSTYSYTLL